MTRALQIGRQLQALLAEGEQQFGLVQAQRLRAVAVGVGQLGDVAFEQRRALAHAQQFVAQHAVGGVGLLQALAVAAHVAAQAVEARFECLHPLCGFDLGDALAFRALVVAVPEPAAGRGERQQHGQPHSAAAPDGALRGRGCGFAGDGGRGAFGHGGGGRRHRVRHARHGSRDVGRMLSLRCRAMLNTASCRFSCS